MPGGLLSMVRDVVKSVPSQIYTDDDYTEKSLSISHRLRIENDPTCVEVEYIDEDTWQVQTVQCYDVNGSSNTPAKISLIGCTNRQHAYEEGMYLYWDDEKNRTTVSVASGLKGLIPATGDMIYISSRQIDWSQSGLLAYYNDSVATLSEPVNFLGSETAQIIFSGKNSGIYGPFVATPLENEHDIAVTLSETIIHDEVHNDPGTAPLLEGVLTDSLPFDPEPDPEDFEDAYVYIYGGVDSSDNNLQDCDEYTFDTWVSKSNMPLPARYGLAASTIGSSGYIYGGDDDIQYLRDCDEYTPDTWVSKSDMPVVGGSSGRWLLAASTIGSSGYVYGGYYSLGPLQDCDEYTPDTWVSKSDMPLPVRYSLAASTIGSSGYVYGGYGGGDLQDCDEYTPDIWVSKSDIPLPGRYGLAASTIGSSGYVYSGSGYIDDCDEYTPDTWTSKANVPAPGRYGSAASAIDTYGFLCGGSDGVGSGLNYCDIYTADIDAWSSGSNMPSPGRYALAASTISQAV
jgi:hypothetical protein